VNEQLFEPRPICKTKQELNIRFSKSGVRLTGNTRAWRGVGAIDPAQDRAEKKYYDCALLVRRDGVY
jgi:hypothetical protein